MAATCIGFNPVSKKRLVASKDDDRKIQDLVMLLARKAGGGDLGNSVLRD